MSMINTHSPMGNHSTTILKKPVVAISEDEKNYQRNKWAAQAKDQKVNKPTKYIA
jgi:hypothetical protein